MNALLLAAVLVTHVPDYELVMVARGDTASVEAYDARTAIRVWSVDGVELPRTAAVSNRGLVAVADPIANRVAVISLTERKSQLFAVPETPAALRFAGETLFVLSRDAQAITRIERGRSQKAGSIEHPTHFAITRGALLVYSAISGALAEYDLQRLTLLRQTRVPPFAADFEADARRAYLAYPRSGRVAAVRLDELRVEDEFAVGAVPVDLHLAGDPSLVSAGSILVADPSSKRIWTVERSQSQAEAFGRGFVRGLVGLGLYRPQSAEFPSGIDRVWSVGRRRFAWDSSSGTLYQIGRGKGRSVLRAGSEREFAVLADRLAVWSNERKTLEFRRLPE